MPFVPFMIVALSGCFVVVLMVLELVVCLNAERRELSALELKSLDVWNLLDLVAARLVKELNITVLEKHVNEWCLNPTETALVIQHNTARVINCEQRANQINKRLRGLRIELASYHVGRKGKSENI